MKQYVRGEPQVWPNFIGVQVLQDVGVVLDLRQAIARKLHQLIQSECSQPHRAGLLDQVLGGLHHGLAGFQQLLEQAHNLRLVANEWRSGGVGWGGLSWVRAGVERPAHGQRTI